MAPVPLAAGVVALDAEVVGYGGLATEGLTVTVVTGTVMPGWLVVPVASVTGQTVVDTGMTMVVTVVECAGQFVTVGAQWTTVDVTVE